MTCRMKDDDRGPHGAAGRRWGLGLSIAAAVGLAAGPALATKTARAVPAEVSANVVLPPANLALLFPGLVVGTGGVTARGLQPDQGGPKAVDHLGPASGASSAGTRLVIVPR